MLGSTFKTILW